MAAPSSSPKFGEEPNLPLDDLLKKFDNQEVIGLEVKIKHDLNKGQIPFPAAIHRVFASLA